MSFNYNVILIHYGEIALKGKNRPDFIARLKENIKQKLRALGLDWPVYSPYGYCYVEIPPEEMARLEAALTALAELAGVVWYGPAHRITVEEGRLRAEKPNDSLIEARTIALAQAHYRPEATFCVRANRGREKYFRRKSPQVERWLGAAIINRTPWAEVNLTEPDRTFYVDIQPEGLFLYTDRRPGIGGLPVGVSGRLMLLLSGGIDSPVAAYLAAKRGCRVDFIHFTVSSLTPAEAAQYKVARLAETVSRFTMRSRLWLVPYTHFDLALMDKQAEYELIIFRRFMARVAERLALRQGGQALLTGDNLGQVASQTLENMVSTSQAVSLPILRPLLTYDKNEIIELARRIETYHLSIEPYKDCCSILQQHPKTRSDAETLAAREAVLLPDYEALIERTLAEAVCLEYAGGRLARP